MAEQKPKPETPLMTVEEAAAYLRVEPKTVYRLINDNEVKAIIIGRVYRIDMADLQEFIKQSKIKVQKSRRKSY